jgi:hypothetical protein
VPSERDGAVRLLKIHGSVDWRLYKERVTPLKRHEGDFNPAMILGICTAGGGRVGVCLPKNDPGDSCLNKGVRTGWGPTLMRARFEGDDSRGPSGTSAGGNERRQRRRLRVGSSRTPVESFGDELPIFAEQDTPDRRIGPLPHS